jgi:hypothetical protein
VATVISDGTAATCDIALDRRSPAAERVEQKLGWQLVGGRALPLER